MGSSADILVIKHAGPAAGRAKEVSMKKLKINTDDKRMIKEYVKWCIKKGFFPLEYDCSKLINNTNGDHRDLVENYLSELRLKQYNNEL